jgi:hypothetical protein
VQFLGIKESTGTNPQIILSDGYVKDTFALYKTIKERMLDDTPVEGTVLEVEVIFHKGRLFIVTDYKIIFKDAPLIGDPIWYLDFVKGEPTSNKATSFFTSLFEPSP